LARHQQEDGEKKASWYYIQKMLTLKVHSWHVWSSSQCPSDSYSETETL